MKYIDFECVFSRERLRRYVLACNNNKRKAMLLYRYNLKLSKEMFAIIGCFEVALRNGIDVEMKKHFGNDWLRDSILKGGMFYNDPKVSQTKTIIEDAYNDINAKNGYSHTKLLSKMSFGTWKYMFNNVQYALTGKCLLNIFPSKPKSTFSKHYNHSFVFDKLERIHYIRNRIAHHEPICFKHPYIIDIQIAKDCCDYMMMLFDWMNVDHKKLLYNLNHVDDILEKIKKFSEN